MSFRSPFVDVEIPDVSVFDYLFAGMAAEEQCKEALVDGPSGVPTSYRELVLQIDAIAGALAVRGVGVGVVVGILAPNVPSYAAVLHGILRAGGTATTINALYTPEDIAKQLVDSKARFLFATRKLLPTAEIAAKTAGLDVASVFVLDYADGYTSLTDLISERRSAPQTVINPSTHVAVLPYSSGTTGRPKGVMLTHRNLVANIAQMTPSIGVTAEDSILAVLPFFHIYGLNVLLNVTFKLRARLVTMPRFDLPQLLRLIEHERLSYLFVAPPLALTLAKHPLVDDYDLSSVRRVFSGAAPLDENLGQLLARRLGADVRQGYGMTEMSPSSHNIPHDRPDIPLNAVGLPLANTMNKIVDPETGLEIALPTSGLSRPGELWIKGPNVMLGYLDNEDATRKTLDAEGYLHTGDLAVADAEGVVYIVDRLKELIKYKGYQVPPAELEALLLTHPEIADAAVIGVPNQDGEEVPKAFVVRQADSDIGPATVMAFVAERVSPHKRVRDVEFVELIPKSASGKILRKDLR